MAEAALLNTLEDRVQDALAKLRNVPPSFWRTLVIAIALIWAVHSISQLVWVIFSPPRVAPPESVAVPVSNTSQQSAPSYSVDLTALKSAQIFGEFVEGEAPEEAINTNQVDVDAEKTKLNLKLVGVVASNDQASSSAVIAKGSDQNIYQVNDKLPAGNNVKLASVFHDRVILDNNGNFEALWLYSEADFKARRTSSPSTSQTRKTRSPEPKEEIEAKIKPSQIPKNLSEVVRFSVHREEGQMVGFRIRPGKNRELFDQMGLKANDIVTSVNGIAIDSPQAIRDNYQQLKTATSADLEIRRGEETLYVNVSIDTELSE